MKSGMLWLLVCLLLAGCLEKEGSELAEELSEVDLSWSSPVGVDSAVVFFFRKYAPSTDTLFQQEVITGKGTGRYKLPAGYYQVVIVGNADLSRIHTSGGFTSSEMLIAYAGGEEPPVLYRGMQTINVGADNRVDFTLMPVTSQVELLIEELPANITKMTVTLFNTGAGIFLNGVYTGQLTAPAITRQFTEVAVADTLIFSCFPSLAAPKENYLKVDCYDVTDKIVFSGMSGLFTVKPGVLTSIRGWFGNQVDFTLSADTGWKF